MVFLLSTSLTCRRTCKTLKGRSPLTLNVFYSSSHLLLVNFTQFTCLDPSTHLISDLLPVLPAPFRIFLVLT